MPFRLKEQKIQLSEKDVQGACIDYLRRRRYWCQRQNSALLYTKDRRRLQVGQPGLPDYSTMHERYPGFWVEFKRPGGKLSPAQIEKHAEITGGFYRLAVVTVESLEQLIAWLDEHERRARSP